MTPRTVYDCGSSDLDRRPGTLHVSGTCEARQQERDGEVMTVKRADWDALLTRIDELERRVGSNDRKIARLVRAGGHR